MTGKFIFSWRENIKRHVPTAALMRNIVTWLDLVGLTGQNSRQWRSQVFHWCKVTFNRWKQADRLWKRRSMCRSQWRKFSRLMSWTQGSPAKLTSCFPGETRFLIWSYIFTFYLLFQRLTFKNLKEDTDENTLSTIERAQVWTKCMTTHSTKTK